MRLTEDELRRITLSAISELGENATPELVKKAVAKAVEKIETSASPLPREETSSGRIILTSFGLNKAGVVANITKALSDADCDIQDITQKIMHDFFTMIMIVDISSSKKDVSDLQKDLAKIADDLKIKIYVQHEDIFRQMHRI